MSAIVDIIYDTIGKLSVKVEVSQRTDLLNPPVLGLKAKLVGLTTRKSDMFGLTSLGIHFPLTDAYIDVEFEGQPEEF